MATIEYRALTLVNTDPERRCYNGCHFSSEWRWTAWSELETGVHPDRVADRLEFWRDLTAYAMRERGKSATKEYRIKQEA